MSRTFPFTAAIFDMDGVLVDTEMFYWQELKGFAEHFDLGVSKDELDRQVGQSQKKFQRLLKSWWERAGRGEVTPEGAEAIFDEWAADIPRDFKALMNPGVPQTLAALKERGVRLALASSSPRATIDAALGACGIADAFEAIVSGEQFHESKPNPEIYLHALGCLGLPAGECCCIEDSVPGITAGKRAGLTVIAKREERFGFSQAEADLIIDQIPDLLELGA